jgi:hypothetical protein
MSCARRPWFFPIGHLPNGVVLGDLMRCLHSMSSPGGVGGVTLGDGVWVVYGEMIITLGDDVVGWWGG